MSIGCAGDKFSDRFRSRMQFGLSSDANLRQCKDLCEALAK